MKVKQTEIYMNLKQKAKIATVAIAPGILLAVATHYIINESWFWKSASILMILVSLYVSSLVFRLINMVPDDMMSRMIRDSVKTGNSLIVTTTLLIFAIAMDNVPEDIKDEHFKALIDQIRSNLNYELPLDFMLTIELIYQDAKDMKAQMDSQEPVDESSKH